MEVAGPRTNTFKSQEQEVVALFGLFGDRMLGQCIELAHGDVEGPRSFFLGVLRFAPIRRGLDGFLGSLGGTGSLTLSACRKTVTGMPRGPASKPARRDAKRPLGLSSTASRSRSSFATKPLASMSSRSSRSFSDLLIGTRGRLQRSIGGMAIVVTTAMVTIIVNRSWLSAPIDSPIEATMISVEPRA